MSDKKISNDGTKKKNENRTSITVVVLGDENVGKSSLISTFVSRHFSEMVPGIMTRVRLPPDPSTTFTVGKGRERKGGGCVTTIVDTQGGDTTPHPSSSSLNRLNSLESDLNTMNLKTSLNSSNNRSGLSGISIENVDAIVLVYDLDRIETFYRLENHWLPYIERCYHGEVPVIIAGNKMDLRMSNPPDEQSQARSRHQIVSLLQHFKFVRQCIKCSAKTLLNVNDVFVKAQHAVLYPINPLYDLSEGKLTPECESAFTRIFRMFDEDNDGLLSNKELNNFQAYCFKVSLMEGDLAGWKKVLAKNNPSEAVVRDGKFTVFGFLAIFDVFISSDRLEIPWIILRIFGYDDDLKLEIPSSVASATSSWRLSPYSLQFLTSIFHQFSSKGEDCLSQKDILSIFSIIRNPSLPPWHPARVDDFLKGSFSFPRILTQNIQTVARKPISGIDEKAPSQTPPTDPFLVPMSLLDWIGQWHMLSSISPTATRAELYRLGHVEDSQHDDILRKKKNKPQSLSPTGPLSLSIPPNAIRAVVIGSRGCGKTAFLNALCHQNEMKESYTPNFLETNPTLRPETRCAHVFFEDRSINGPKSGGVKKHTRKITELVLTEIPTFEIGEYSESELSSFISDSNNKFRQGFDLVIFLFDCTKESSLSYVIDLEKRMLTDDIPRVFIGSKNEITNKQTNPDSDIKKSSEGSLKETVKLTMEKSFRHCEELDLESPMFVYASPNGLGGTGLPATNFRAKVLENVARCALDKSDHNRLRARPFAERKRRDAEKRRKMLWFGGLMSASVAVVIGVGMFWGQKDDRKGRMGWLKNLFFLGGIHSVSKTDTSDRSKEV